MRKLSMTVQSTIRKNVAADDPKIPTSYLVSGMPIGRGAIISNPGAVHRSNWQILEFDERPVSDETAREQPYGDFSDADAALKFLEEKLNATEPV